MEFQEISYPKKFPDSFLSLTLQDLTAEDIIINNPDVTPTVISLLYIIIEECGDFTSYIDKLEFVLENEIIVESIQKSSRYLLIPELNLFTDPNIVMMLHNSSFGEMSNPMYNTAYNPESYLILMRFTIGNNYPENMRKLFEQVLSTDSILFFESIFDDKLWAVQLFVKERGINPNTAKLPGDIIVSYSILSKVRSWLYDVWHAFAPLDPYFMLLV